MLYKILKNLKWILEKEGETFLHAFFYFILKLKNSIIENKSDLINPSRDSDQVSVKQLQIQGHSLSVHIA